MAEKISPSDHPAARAALQNTPNDAAPAEGGDLDILLPERDLEINGETVTVRELNFGEQLKYGQALAALAESLRPVLQEAGKTQESAPDTLTLILDALSLHAETVSTLVARCCDKDKKWLETLPGNAGENLLILWWSVNSSFFIRRLIVRPQQLKAEIARQTLAAALKRQSDGGASSARSSGTDITLAT
ncbi:MAG: hypothetical protein LBQ81_12140 [Zoogloeaceae bacterium]|jgi:hypothetical protein|nr:hypothetical protein [Zoogloeaceae bacterium]